MTSPQGPPGPQGPRPPGWYDDPNVSGAPRWWDGRQWAPPSGPRPAPGGYGYGSRFRPQSLIDESSSGKRAAVALWVGAACQATQLIATAFYLHEFWVQFDKLLSSSSSRSRSSTPTLALSGSATAAQAVSQIASLGSLVVYVIFLVWFHRAATNARDVGIPARRSPGWAVGGWFIPIGNFFLPYQSARDFFPADHPDRKLVGQWWACYLGGGLSATLVFGASFVSVPAGLVACVVPVALYVLAALKGRQLIERSLAVHVEAATHHGLVGPGFDPASPISMAGPYAAAPGPSGPSAAPGAGPGAVPGPGPSPWDTAGSPPRDPWSSS